MTAIKTGAASNQRAAVEATSATTADLPSAMGAQRGKPLHPPMAPQSGCAGQKKATNTDRELQSSHSSVVEAKERFVSATSAAMEKLRACGYGRERATMLLLREVGKGVTPPTEQEVFKVMKSMGLGMEEASRVAAVSRAVQRARKEHGLSAIEAIEDLTSRLGASKLFGGEPMTAPPRTSICSHKERPYSPPPNRGMLKKSQPGGVKPSKGKLQKGKPASRKRQLSHIEDQNSSTLSKSARPPNNHIDAALAQKQKLSKKNSDDEKQTDTPDDALASLPIAKAAPPAVVSVRPASLKRGVPHHSTDDATRTQPPPIKRTRPSANL